MPYCLLSTVPTSAEWWPIALPLLLGGASIYSLLPRPKAYPSFWGAALGLLALVSGGLLLTRGGIASMEAVLFWSFSILGIVSGVLLVTQHNPARAALAFALVVLSTCGLFLLLAAPFLMAATIIIYAGAIIVTFLFVIMLAQPRGLSDADDRSREPGLATITGFALLATLLLVLQRYEWRVHATSDEINPLVEKTQQLMAMDDKKDILTAVGEPWDADPDLFKQYKNVYRAHHWDDLVKQVEDVEISWSSIKPTEPRADNWKSRLHDLLVIGASARHRLAWLPPAVETPLSDLSGPPPTVEGEHLRLDAAGLPRMPADNAAYLGRSLFTDFLLPVELGGTLLLAATVGAIAIAFRRS
jgi:NADH-quinone oxidoreductase subunit J